MSSIPLSFRDYQLEAMESLHNSELTRFRDGLIEEASELLIPPDTHQQVVITRCLQGRASIVCPELRKNIISELGDILWYLTACCEVTGGSLQKSVSDTLDNKIRPGCRSNSGIQTFKQLERIMTYRVGNGFRLASEPDIDSIMFYGFPLFEEIDPQYQSPAGPAIERRKPFNVNGRLFFDDNIPTQQKIQQQVYGQGRYTLTTAIREVVEATELEDATLQRRAGEAVVILSGLAITRFGISLEETATKNLEKIARRIKNGTLMAGHDPERDNQDTERIRVRNADAFSALTFLSNIAGQQQ